MTNESNRIQKRLIAYTAIAIAAIVAIAICAAAFCIGDSGSNKLREEILHLNEVRTSLLDTNAAGNDAGKSEAGESAIASIELADDALASTQDILRSAVSEQDFRILAAILTLSAASIAAVLALSLYMYFSVIRPFIRLEDFAGQVANGNLDAPLAYERSNPFGRFAWAFDHLRAELKRSREKEQAAALAYKTALASLSHDLRTPLASLRTYAEALELQLDQTPEERLAYERIIMSKCDEAAELVEDLLVHALADMDRIDVTCTATPVAPILHQCASNFAEAVHVTCVRADQATLNIDSKRLKQVVDNLLVNAAKYATGSAVEISGMLSADAYRITVRDFGTGAAAEDIPFLAQRFYRGANAKDKTGAGLGLFIANYLMNRMNGTMQIQNANPGLCIVLELPLPHAE
ncbi:HAMP domain-containing sensor histidine kinase [Adlercreutzia sp. ZJ154]|uniref:HAMP domain-containing sensor histidine kinase n=1 Tax=Adlercreutzia sp. ZJ154 TaxID=2709790 RepID=UPI0013EDDC20|nr:HAMP domain-containing sensor histidine kinase [Adlercreutzia sp. ZJ154]